MNTVLERASSTLDHVGMRLRPRWAGRHVEPEIVDEPEEEGSSLALFFWGALTALVLWWLYLRPPSTERRAATLRQGERPPRRPAPAPERSSAEPVEVVRDDLTLIYGIGPARAARLYEVGIASFAALAVADNEQLRDILAGVGVSTADMETWAEQAALAAKGDWDGLEAFHERLRAERG
jgi:predicted flap endonuclease-1-like 5' DNA nuclease